MNKHHREESESKMRGRDRECKAKKMSSGGMPKADHYKNMVGEKTHKTSESNEGWSAVNAMLDGKHPTTHIATVKCGGEKAMKMAAGGVGKIRKGQYN